MNLIDAKTDFENLSEGELTIIRSQEIPQSFLDSLKEDRNDSTHGRMGEMHRFASIPVAVFEHWLRQGFDPRRESPAKVMARMKAEGLDYFITTERRL